MKNKNGWIWIWLISTALFHLIVFLSDCEHDSVFWVLYGFSMLSFFMQIPLWKRVIKDRNRTVLGIAGIIINSLYLVLQVILFFIFQNNNIASVRTVIKTCGVLFGVDLILTIALNMCKEAENDD